MITIQIKSIFGDLLFEHKSDNNTIKETVEKAIKKNADLRYANLISANLSYADLRYANLISANLSYANLSYADLSYADLRYANLSSANLSYADLSSADLISANLSYADLSSADLSYANLRYVNLSSADLSYANLRSVNLSSAKTDKRYISISCIGSRKDMTTYCFEYDTIWCGCFKGTLSEFESKVNKTHKNNPQYLSEYIGFINYLKSLKA